MASILRERGSDVVEEREWLLERFEEQRPRLRALAYRMLGSLADTDDALQEAWLRASRAGTGDVENLAGWLTTIVARVCLNMLRSRRTHGEQPIDAHDVRVPDPLVSREDEFDPEHEALLADAVGLALLVVLETLSPSERLAFVLHDMFAVPFEEIARLLERSPTATRQLASRARRRVRAEAPAPDSDLHTQREVVDAFFEAAHKGDFEALLAVLHPDVVLRSDGGRVRQRSAFVRGAQTVAGRALTFARLSPYVHPALVNGAAGVVVAPNGRPFSVMSFTVSEGKIVAIDAVADPDRLSKLNLAYLGGWRGLSR